MDAELHAAATKLKQRSLLELVRTMPIKEKRNLFGLLRAEGVEADTFLPGYGLFCSEFAYYYVLADHVKKEQRREDVAGA